jgi:hypothetical protein
MESGHESTEVTATTEETSPSEGEKLQGNNESSESEQNQQQKDAPPSQLNIEGEF